MKAGFATLGEVAEFINGAAFKPSDWGDVGKKIIRIQNLTDSSKPYNKTTRSVNKKLTVNYGDILVSWSATLGVFVWTEKDEAVLNQHIFKVIHNSNIIDKNYLRHCLHQALDAMTKHLHGATMKHVNRGEFLATEIPLPPLAEQQRIAALLDTADHILKQRESAIAKLDTLANSIFIEMFSHLIADQKSQVKLKQVCKKITDGTHQSPKWEESGIPFLFISNIVNSEITFETHKFISTQTYEQLTKSTPISINDILFTSVGSYGNVAIVKNDKKFCFQRHIAHIKPDANKVTTIFLAAMLRTHHVKQQVDRVAKGVAQKTVNLGDLSDISVICPTLEDQHMFNTKIEAIEAMRDKFHVSFSNLKKTNASLQHQSFTVN